MEEKSLYAIKTREESKKAKVISGFVNEMLETLYRQEVG
jgi:hypothetical protein